MKTKKILMLSLMAVGLTSNIVRGDNIPTKENQDQTNNVILDTLTNEISEKLTDKALQKTITNIDTNAFAKEAAAEGNEKQSTNKDVAEAVPQIVADDITEKVADDITEKVADDITEKVADDITEKVADDITEKVADDITEKAKIEAQKLVDAEAKTNSAIAEIKPKLLTIIWQKIRKVSLNLGKKIGIEAVLGLLDGDSLADSIFNASKKVFTEEINNLSANK